MNDFIKQVIEEKFASKAQQRYFYAKANEKGSSKKEKKQWKKWASEFSSKTKFDEIIFGAILISTGKFLNLSPVPTIVTS
jgi:hypothetical protein